MSNFSLRLGHSAVAWCSLCVPFFFLSKGVIASVLIMALMDLCGTQVALQLLIHSDKQACCLMGALFHSGGGGESTGRIGAFPRLAQ